MRSRDRRYNDNNGPPLPCHGSRLRGVVIDTLLLSRRTAFAKHALKVRPTMARAFAACDRGEARTRRVHDWMDIFFSTFSESFTY